MRSSKLPQLTIAALAVLCFGVAARLDTWFQNWPGSRAQSFDLLNVTFGDSRRLFANHFFVKADAYFHSGYYPTIFDNREAFQTPHMAEDAGAVAGKNHGDETGFLGKPRDWIDAFNRKFLPATHTHLDQGGPLHDLGDTSSVREILPWLQLSAQLDPNDIRTYVVSAYWLRERMGKANEAERFLRKGLAANPGSYEILYELGRLFAENSHDTARARNLWEVALRNWHQQESSKPDPDNFLYLQITSHLAHLERGAANYDRALAYLEMWKSKAPYPDEIQKDIDELRQKMSAPKSVSFQKSAEKGPR